MKIDITECSDRELSLQVFNTEDLYNSRHDEGLLYLINVRFDHTFKQLEILIQDIKEDAIEGGLK